MRARKGYAHGPCLQACPITQIVCHLSRGFCPVTRSLHCDSRGHVWAFAVRLDGLFGVFSHTDWHPVWIGHHRERLRSRSLIEAAIDGGANGWQMLTNVVIPLCKPGIAIGSIFVVTLVMGDYITVRLMGGGQRASVGVMMWNEISLLLYPAAAAHAVVLLAVVLIMVSLMMRVVDLKKEL